MLLEILGMAMINPMLDNMENLDRIAYENKHIKTIEVVKDNYSGEYDFPHRFDNFNKYYSEHETEIKNVIEDFNSRKMKNEQYLKWVSY